MISLDLLPFKPEHKDSCALLVAETDIITPDVCITALIITYFIAGPVARSGQMISRNPTALKHQRELDLISFLSFVFLMSQRAIIIMQHP